jgi:hypothetical protein
MGPLVKKILLVGVITLAVVFLVNRVSFLKGVIYGEAS